MASKYMFQVPYWVCFLDLLAAIIQILITVGYIGQPSGVQVSSGVERIETPFGQCQSNTELRHFRGLLRNCTKLDQEAEEYPFELKGCVCGVFVDKSNALYWLSLSDPFIDEVAKAVATSWSVPPEPEGLFVDHFSGMAPQDLAMRHYDGAGIWANVASSNSSSLSRLEWQQSLEITKKENIGKGDGLIAKLAGRRIILRRCKSILDKEIINSIWELFNKFHDLTGDVHFGRSVFDASDKLLKDLLFQRDFCLKSRNRRISFSNTAAKPV